VTPIDVVVGDRVVYSKFAGTEVRVSGVAHLVLKAEDVIGTLAGDDIGALKPYGDRLLVAKAGLGTTTSGGILLPGAGQDTPTGRVLAVGPGKLREEGGREPLHLAPGASVLYTQFAGMEFAADDTAPAGYVVLRSDDIICALS
jgi:chaperonin GroES